MFWLQSSYPATTAYQPQHARPCWLARAVARSAGRAGRALDRAGAWLQGPAFAVRS